mmetsp:Transcript_31125/g.78614  ORF Transcript_31125/g.78614 Transcript_31125/m.78614 type:complete len:294 (+) Transcript_31125:1704-2585(+)
MPPSSLSRCGPLATVLDAAFFSSPRVLCPKSSTTLLRCPPIRLLAVSRCASAAAAAASNKSLSLSLPLDCSSSSSSSSSSPSSSASAPSFAAAPSAISSGSASPAEAAATKGLLAAGSSWPLSSFIDALAATGPSSSWLLPSEGAGSTGLLYLCLASAISSATAAHTKCRWPVGGGCGAPLSLSGCMLTPLRPRWPEPECPITRPVAQSTTDTPKSSPRQYSTTSCSAPALPGLRTRGGGLLGLATAEPCGSVPKCMSTRTPGPCATGIIKRKAPRPRSNTLTLPFSSPKAIR